MPAVEYVGVKGVVHRSKTTGKSRVSYYICIGPDASGFTTQEEADKVLAALKVAMTKVKDAKTD